MLTDERLSRARDAPLPGELTALVNIGASVMNINILKGGSSAFTRDITIGGNRYTERLQQDLGLSFEEAENAKKGHANGADEAAISAAVAAVDMEVASEIGRSFDYFRTTSSYDDIARIVISGGCAKIKTLAPRIAEHLSLETVLGDPFRSLDITGLKISPEELAEMAPSAAVVVGLALRQEGDR